MNELKTTFPSNVKVTSYKFTLAEVYALYRLFEREWIPRDDEEIMEVTKRITTIINNELVR